MNHTSSTTTLTLIACFLFASCSREEPAETATEVAPVEEEAVVDTVQQPPPEMTAPDEPVEVVEESAAEPEEQTADQTILLATTPAAPAPRDWKFKEGVNYARMIPTQPTVGGADKIEVAEFFWYGCGHCFDFEPVINRWAENKPAGVRFVRIPATWNPLVMLHAQLYYTEEVLAKNGKIANPEEFRNAVFQEYHRRGNRMSSVESIQSVFTRHGVSPEDFNATWKSFEVAQKLRVAQDLARRYSISGVPSIVVNGKYRTGAAEAGGNPKLIEVIDELVARESQR